MTTEPEPRDYPDSFFVSAYWGARKESPEACASRAAVLLEALADCDPLLDHWYKSIRSRKGTKKLSLMPPDVSVLTDLFRQGTNREGGRIFEELGFMLWINNGGAPSDYASLRLRCGDYAGTSPNSCFLSLPFDGPTAERVLTPSVLESVMRGMVAAWEPDWTVAMSDAHQEMDDPDNKTNAWVGWLTYFSKQRGTVPPLPAPVRIEPVEDKGTLIVLTPERFTVANPEHMALARRVRELLTRAGLIKAR
ncbi:immunity 52 family protein [Corallococcus sp. EGB]|uniref:immunity 52 family protein n=1 Tax=Corallococcus sp. EGB TaxID=1521117 RepID=UPI00351CED91